jgi:S1-C subfamily serine protease
MTVLIVLSSLICSQTPLPDSPRVTPVVRLIREIEPCVAAVFYIQEGGQIASGSGTVIHPDGFILTNNHVAAKDSGYVLLKDDQPRSFDVVGRLPAKDLAIIRVHAGRRLPTIPIGRSHDLLTGEPVIVAGNPGGRGITFTTGILSSAAFLAGGPNALVMTNFDDSRRDRFIQFDAASNPGNSGGPLVNMEGNLIGIVSGSVPQEQNIGLAIPIDRLRRFFEITLDPEVRRGIFAGLQLDPLDDGALVSGVIKNSPAEASGVLKGDSIVAVNGGQIRHAMDWWMTLAGKSVGDEIDVIARRSDERLALRFALAEKPLQPSVEVSDLIPGLRYRFFHGQFSEVPAFAQLKPVREGIVGSFDLDQIRGDREEDFAVEFSGYLRIPEDGIYRLVVVSDDGSMVYIDGELAVDNNFSHPPQPMSRLLRLAKGLHAVRLDYFQGKSGKALQVLIGQEAEPTPVGSDSLFHQERPTE